MPSNESLGQPVRPFITANCSNSVDQKRYRRCTCQMGRKKGAPSYCSDDDSSRSIVRKLLTQNFATVKLTLITRLKQRTRYLNAQNTVNQLLDMGVIPIVNENDTLAVSEIKFGDNDTLSAITAAMIHADLLFLMTDVDCLYDKNPRTNPDAKPIEIVSDFSVLDADGKLESFHSRFLRAVFFFFFGARLTS